MIKRKPSNHNLRNKQFQFIDTNVVSKDFFRVDLPEKFYIGKNSFTIKPTDNLLKGSQIQIDILDVNKNNIYFEVTDILTESNSRLISVYIYPDTPFGEIEILIAGTTKLNSSVLWKREITFSFTPVMERPLFKTSPKVLIQERQYQILEQTSSRLTQQVARSNHRLSIKSNENKDYRNEILKLNDRYVEPQPLIPTTQEIASSSVDFGLVGVTTNPSNIVVNREIIPLQTFNYDVVYVTSSFFSSSMAGGILEFNLQDYMTTNHTIPPTLNSDYVKASYKYTSSIVEVIDDTKIKIYPNFHYYLNYQNVNYLSVKTLTNLTNFTASYYDYEQTGSSITTSSKQSFLYCEIKGLEPVSGQVEYIDVFYKPHNNIGEFSQLGSVKVDKKDLLINSNKLQNINQQLQYKRLGQPNTPTDVLQNWTSSIVGQITSSNFDFRDGTSNTGIVYLNHTKIFNTSSYIKLFTTQSYDFISSPNAEYEMTFGYEYDTDSLDLTLPQLDLYVSGSSLYENITKNNIGLVEGNLGEYVGSVTNKKSSGKVQVNFITNELKQNKVYFVIRGGQWKLSDITVQPRHEVGFNASEMFFLLPIKDLIQRDEYHFKLKYRNGLNYSNIETNLYGMMFSGSNYNIGTATTTSEILTVVETIDFPLIDEDGGSIDVIVTVTGAEVGDAVLVTFPSTSIQNLVVFHYWVSNTNQVTIRAYNNNAFSVDFASANYTIKIFK